MTNEKQRNNLIAVTAGDLVSTAFGASLNPVSTAATGFALVINSLMQKRLEKARDLFVSELKKGHVDVLDVENPDEFVPIVIRYIRAASEGAAHINLRLMAKIMCGNAINPSLYASDFLAYADLISSLWREEVVFLATMVKLTRAGNKIQISGDSGKYYDLDQSVEIELKRSLVGTVFFPDLESVNACELALQRTGFLRHVSSLSSGGDIYAPSPRLERLAALADFENVLKEEGIEIKF